MTDQSPSSPSPRSPRLRLLAPLAVLMLVLAGAATAAATTGVFERNNSGFDSPRDITERGTLVTTPSTTASENDPGVDLAPGETQTFPAGDAGSVTVRRDGNVLTLVAVNANPGWASEVEQGTAAEVEVKFGNGTTRVDFNAELEDGAVRTRVRVSTIDAPEEPTTLPTTPTTTPENNSGSDNAQEDNSGTDNENENEGADDSGADNSGSGNSGSGNSGSDNSGSDNSGSGSSGNSGSGNSGSGNSGSEN